MTYYLEHTVLAATPEFRQALVFTGKKVFSSLGRGQRPPAVVLSVDVRFQGLPPRGPGVCGRRQGNASRPR
eukprot:5867583-Lingulodinium_polyedra.AAC.1